MFGNCTVDLHRCFVPPPLWVFFDTYTVVSILKLLYCHTEPSKSTLSEMCFLKDSIFTYLLTAALQDPLVSVILLLVLWNVPGETLHCTVLGPGGVWTPPHHITFVSDHPRHECVNNSLAAHHSNPLLYTCCNTCPVARFPVYASLWIIIDQMVETSHSACAIPVAVTVVPLWHHCPLL